MIQKNDGSLVVNMPNVVQRGLRWALGVPQPQPIQKARTENIMPPLARLHAQNEYYPGSGNAWAQYVDGIKHSGLVYDATYNYAVTRNLRILGQGLAAAKLMVETRDPNNPEGWNPVLDHPLERILEGQMNPFQSQSDAWIIQSNRLHIYGEAYWMQVPNQNGDLLQLWPLPPERMQVIPHPTKFVAGYWYTPITGVEPEFLRVEDVVYHRFPNHLPGQSRTGLSPITAFVLGLQTNTEMARTDFNDIKNSLNLHQLLILPSDTGNTNFSLVINDLNASVNEGKRFLAIRADEADIKNTSSPRTGGYSQAIMSLTEDQINSVLGFPADYWRGNSNRSSKQEVVGMVVNNIWNLAVQLAEDFTAQMVIPRYGPDTRVVFKDFRPRNVKEDLEVTKSDREVQTYNEARLANGGEEHPETILGLMPANVANSPQVIVELLRQGYALDGSAPVSLITETSEPTSESVGEPTDEAEEVEAEEEAESDEDEPESKAQSPEYLSIVKALNEVSGAVLLGEELM